MLKFYWSDSDCKQTNSWSISINYRVFSDENLSNFKNSLQDINWNPVLINDDADTAYDLFQSTLLTVFNEHFPIQTKNISSGGKSKLWITPGILAAIRRKRRLENKAARIAGTEIYSQKKPELPESSIIIIFLRVLLETVRKCSPISTLFLVKTASHPTPPLN